MLSEVSASEFNDWIEHFSKTPFTPQLIDTEFAALQRTIVTSMCGADVEMTDFMLLTDIDFDDNEMSDEVIQLVGSAIPGGLRYEPTTDS